MTRKTLTRLVAAATLAACAAGAAAQTVKIGVVLPYTGVGAEFGQQVDRGMQVYMKLNPGAFAPYKVELVRRDAKNPGGATAKTAVQELIAQDNVDILAGFIYSPNAIASAPLASAGKKPMVVMNAGTKTKNTSGFLSFARWKNGVKSGTWPGPPIGISSITLPPAASKPVLNASRLSLPGGKSE